MLIEHVLAGNADVSSAVLHIGGHISGAPNDELQIGRARRQDEASGGLWVFQHLYACLTQQWEGFLENPAFGQGQGDGLVDAIFCHGSQVRRSILAPTVASLCSICSYPRSR